MPFRGTLQDIRMFVAVYEERSFTIAAARENTTQPSVSHHIRNLEGILNVKLFVRENLGVTATPAARLLYPRYTEILRDIDNAANQVKFHALGHQGKLCVGVSPALCRYLTASTLVDYEQTHPNVAVRIKEVIGKAALDMVKSGKVDFAICSLSGEGEEGGVRVRTLTDVQNCLISRSLPESSNIVSHALPDQPLNLIWASVGGERYRTIVASLHANGMSIGKEMVLDSPFTALHLVAKSDWRIVAPCVVVDPILDAPHYSMLPLRKADSVFPISLVESVSRGLDPSAEDFIKILIERIRQADMAWEARFVSAI